MKKSLLLAVLCIPLIGGIHTVVASSWSPTLKVNTEPFTIIDDSAGLLENVYLQFGDTLAETLTFHRANNRFEFSDDVYVNGDIEATGAVTASQATLTGLVDCSKLRTNALGQVTCNTDPSILHVDTSSVVTTGAGWITAYSVVIPGGTIGVGNALDIDVWADRTSGTSSAAFRVLYGGAQIVAMGNNGNDPARIDVMIKGDGATNAQKGFMDHSNSGNGGTNRGNVAINSTVDQTLQIQINPNVDTNNWTFEYLSIEVLEP